MATVSLQAAYDHARRLLESGDTERAIAAIEHILQYFPHNLEAQRMLGQAYRAGRQLDLARNAFQNVLASDPENIEAYVGIGLIHESQGKLDQAIQSFEQALEITPGMKELRAEVLRLYTENWGSEHAQLQVSQSALARMYAKGYMFPQAILEFRKLIAKDPSRLDAHVALAETLWRDGQDDEAIAESEEILRNHPYALKPNLLLGYLQAASGDPQSEEHWNRAGEVDPYYGVAQQLFEQLPYPPTQQTLPEWDEHEWTLERERLAQEKARAEEEANRASIVEPIAAAGIAAAASNDDNFFGGSWMDSVETPAEAPASGDDEDFLAKLLAFDGISADDDLSAVQSDASSAPFSVEDVAPMADAFSFDDQDLAPFGSEEQAADSPAASAPASDDIDDFEPFSYADLGLSPEEIAALSAGEPSEQDFTTNQVADEPVLADEPAVIDDFDLLGADLGSALPEETTPSASSSDDEPDLTPFSFADLGLSPEEIAAFEGASSTSEESEVASVASDEPVEAFDFDLPSVDEEPAVAAASDDEPDMTPFSLEDLGLSDADIAEYDLGGSDDSATPAPVSDESLDDVQPFSLDDWASDLPDDGAPVGEGSENFDFSDELAPFSLDDLDISSAGAQGGNFELGSLPSSLQPFSLDDLPEGLGFSSDAGASLPSPSLPDDTDEDANESGAYGFRPARSKSSTDFKLDQDEEAPSGSSIFAKLRQRHSELPQTEPEPLPPVDDNDIDHSLFGNDDISLRVDEDESESSSLDSGSLGFAAQDTAQPETAPQSTDAQPEMTPFSLADLGLSPEEIAALGLQDAEAEGTVSAELPESLEEPFSFESETSAEEPGAFSFENDLAGEEPGAFSFESESVAEEPEAPAAATDDEPDMTPFSFADLGLSPEEIASFGLADAAVESGLVEDPSEVLGDGFSFESEPAIEEEAFSFESEPAAEEPGAFSFESESVAEEPEAPAAANDDEPDMTPFSLADLGLSPEEIAALGLGDAGAESGLAAETSAIEEEAFSFESEPVAEEPAAPAAANDDEPDMTPFSLADLGLSPEEVAALGLGDASQTSEAAPSVDDEEFELPSALNDDEPDMTPFSLADLGLSPEEIAALGLEDGGAGASSEAAEPAAEADGDFGLPSNLSEEPDMTPFSLEELGLSAEDAATLGLEDLGTVEADTGAVDSDSAGDIVYDFDLLGDDSGAFGDKGGDSSFDDDIRPFSLEDLGLDDEIAPNPFSFDMGNELGVTEEEMSAMKLDSLGQDDLAAPAETDDSNYQVDTGDPVLDELIMIGRRQGFVDLDDIIRAVENPEEESDRIEEIGLVLHRAGIQIRDGDEIIDLDEEVDEEDYLVYAEDEAEEEYLEPAVTSNEEPDMTPFSLEDLGLSADEIAALGLQGSDADSTAGAASSSDEQDMTPFSLEDLGLSADEIASLDMGADLSAPAAETPAASSDEPDMSPFSLEDLGLSADEIAALGLEGESAPASQESSPAEEAPAASSDEPEMTPFTFEDLGLSPEEIALLSGVASQEAASEEQPAAGDEFDTFDFSVAEAARSELAAVAPSEPRQFDEEEAPPLSPEDLAFVPADLESLDSIWDPETAKPTSPSQDPSVAAVVATPEPPKRDLPPINERIVRFEKPQAEPEPKAPVRSEPVRSEPTRSAPSRNEPVRSDTGRGDTASSQSQTSTSSSARSARPGTWKVRQSPTAFIPTGDSALDGYLLQLEAEPNNTALRASVARIGGQTARFDLAIQQYKTLIKSGDALDQISEDIQELIEDNEEPEILQKLYRLLGDVYSKQNRFREAVEAYSWTFSK
jgi:tetratricopeptide (TPR) repeat protein